jgi:hypothetical protein
MGATLPCSGSSKARREDDLANTADGVELIRC